VSAKKCDLVELCIEDACRQKWIYGRKEYGGDTFIGHPGEEAFSEGVDLLNYLDEWERQGQDVGDVRQVVEWATRRIQRLTLDSRQREWLVMRAGGSK
jgi:hypothetical protein